MILNDYDNMLLNGEKGSMIQKGMEILVKLGEAFDAERMIWCEGAHLYSPALYTYNFLSEEEIDQQLELIRKEKVKVVTPSTTIACGPDMDQLQVERFNSNFLRQIEKCMEIYREMGVILNISCTPYLQGIISTPKQHLEYCESSNWIFANSVLGSSSNRGGTSSLFAAITGRIPEYGMHLRRNRLPNKIINVEAAIKDPIDVGSLFFLVGKYSDNTWDVPAIKNIKRPLTLEEYKQACGALSASGAAAMFHIDGYTPEARNGIGMLLEGQNLEEINIGQKDIDEARYNTLCSAKEKDVQMVLLGCPHASIQEIKFIAEYIAGKRVKDDVRLWIQTIPEVKNMANEMGYSRIIEEAGGYLLNHCCTIMLVKERKEQTNIEKVVHNVATNSVKFAYYAPAQYTEWGVWYGSIEECINASITGKFERIERK